MNDTVGVIQMMLQKLFVSIRLVNDQYGFLHIQTWGYEGRSGQGVFRQAIDEKGIWSMK